MPLTMLRSPDAAARWLSSWVTGTLRTDSRRVQPGDAFIAWPGYATDGRRFVRAALDAGATTCLVEADGIALRATARLTGKTGVEMEALTAVSVAALTIYDMCKAIDKQMTIEGIRLLKKTGGRSSSV